VLKALALLAVVASTATAACDAAGTAGRWLIDGYRLVLSPLQPPNTCTFEPTCSQFTRRAIEAYGLIPGMVVGADRLLRCQPFAWSQRDRRYLGLTGGRLNDPPAGDIARNRPPPLPQDDRTPTAPPADLLAAGPGADALDFARWLWDRRDWHRAGVEFTRAARLLPDGDDAARVGMMAGEAFLRAGEYDAARASFIDAAPPAEGVALFGAARADFAAGRYDSCQALLSRIHDVGLERDVTVLSGWCHFRADRFTEGAATFAGTTEPGLAPLAAMDGRDIPRRSRALAAVLSALVPGAGQLYAGLAGDGAYSFIAVAGTGLLAWWFASDAPRRDPHRVKLTIFATTAALFHAGNIYGASIAARESNRWQEHRHVERVDELLARVRLTPGIPWPVPAGDSAGAPGP
jgi:putative membrane protein insertion efficiency factor